MNRILELNVADRYARVQPGVTTATVQRAAEAAGLFYPPDPASAQTCTIGGNVATGAGGLRAVKYGVTRDYVLGLTAVRVGGTVLRTGVLTLKGVVGYDLTRLLVGSEGTLAVITEIVLRLVAKPESRRTLLAGFDSVERACLAVGKLLSCGVLPDAIELMDEGTLAALREHGHATAAGFPATLLLIEVDGPAARIDDDAATVRGVLESCGAARVEAAASETESDALWSARRAVAPAVYALAKAKLSEDVTVPISRLPALVAGVRAIAERHGLRHLSYGHAGDGNLHVNLLHDTDDEQRRAREAVSELFDLTLRLGGTISGEHGIGLSKRAFIARELSPEVLQISRALKRVFDPDNLLNPGKVFPEP
jgi:glycolate oxidase subunit GlcD